MTTYYHIQQASYFNKIEPKPPHSLVLKPSVPKEVFIDSNGYRIEDWFTSRVSLAREVKKAVQAIDARGYIDVYETVSSVTIVQPLYTSKAGAPQSPGNVYGEEFDFEEWVVYIFGQDYFDSLDLSPWTSYGALPYEIEKKFAHCVPDAGTTGEVWSLKPVPVRYLGLYHVNGELIEEPNEDSNRKAAKFRTR